MTLVERKFNFFIVNIFMPMIERLNENGIIKTWDKTLESCQFFYEMNRKTLIQLAIDEGLSHDTSDDFWIIKLCNGKSRVRTNIKLVLAEDGYKVAKVKFEGIKITKNPEEINDSNMLVLQMLDGRMQSEQVISELLAETNPGVKPLSELAAGE